ncbi:hypothetical protein AB0N38_14215 [Micromonospora aurantiaca]|uniref:hypothetical protein n=1 Tax=Micromonospora aurantiaca (nom. illeg.) TaxID=47850 RepID=UPI003418CDA1
MRMPIVVTTMLDVLGLLLVAAGVGAGLLPVVGWWCLVPAGGVVIAGSIFGALRDRDGDGS